MWRLILGLFLIAHGLVHAGIWLAPLPSGGDGVPFDPKHSWLINGLFGGDAMRVLSILLAAAAALGFVLGGAGLLAHQGWWRPVVIGAAVVSLVLIGLYFHPWLSAGLGLELVILVALVWANWPAQELVGP